MVDLLAHSLHQLAFALITGQTRLTTEQAAAVADLNAAAAIIAQAEACEDRPRLRLVPQPDTKERA